MPHRTLASSQTFCPSHGRSHLIVLVVETVLRLRTVVEPRRPAIVVGGVRVHMQCVSVGQSAKVHIIRNIYTHTQTYKLHANIILFHISRCCCYRALCGSKLKFTTDSGFCRRIQVVWVLGRLCVCVSCVGRSQ